MSIESTIEIKVTPRAKKDEIRGWDGQTLLVRVKAPPVDDAANEALTRLLSKNLGIPKGHIEIVRGHRGRRKIVRVLGIMQSVILTRWGSARR